MLVAVASALAITACSAGGAQPGATAETGMGSATGPITVWAHQGTTEEVAAIQAAVSGFNSSQSGIKVDLKLIPGDSYTTTVNNTPTDQMPDVLDMDGPTVANYAYNGKLQPIDELVSKATVSNATDGSIAEGTYNGKLYALAQFDSAMGFFGNKKLFDAAGVKYPTSAADAWTADEFAAAVKTLAATNSSGKSLDITESALSGEWGTYGFAPLIWSAGGNLIQDDKSQGVLDSAASVAAMTAIRHLEAVRGGKLGRHRPSRRAGSRSRWVATGSTRTTPRRSAQTSWFFPLPNMGNGAKAGAGSWTWGIGASSKSGKAAGAFIDYLLNDDNVKAMTSANGAPPATKTAFQGASLYQSGGALALWGNQLANACPASNISGSTALRCTDP